MAARSGEDGVADTRRRDAVSDVRKRRGAVPGVKCWHATTWACAMRPWLTLAALGDFAVGAEDGAPTLPFEGRAGVSFAAGGYVAMACYVVEG